MKKFTLAHLIKQKEIFTLEDPLTFIAEEDNCIIQFGSYEDRFSIRYDKNDSWEHYILGTELTLNKRTICTIQRKPME